MTTLASCSTSAPSILGRAIKASFALEQSAAVTIFSECPQSGEGGFAAFAQVRQNLVDDAIHAIRGFGPADSRLARDSLCYVLLLHADFTVPARSAGKTFYGA